MARSLSDTILAAWLAGGGKAVSLLPPPTDPPPIGVLPSRSPEDLVRFPAVEAAAADLAARKVLTRDAYDALDRASRSAAFTVARVATEDGVRAVRDALVRDVAEGGTLRQFAERVEEALGESQLSPAHLETVYRTAVAEAHANGLREVLDHPLVSDGFPYVEYTATHDSRARHEHLEMERLGLDGTAVYRRDDPTIQKFWPPWGYNCRCVVIPLSIEDAARKGVREAKEGLQTGLPPEKPEWVEPPPFDLPPGWAGRGQH